MLLTECVHLGLSCVSLESFCGFLLVCAYNLRILLLGLSEALCLLKCLSVCLSLKLCVNYSLLLCIVSFLIKELSEVVVDYLGNVLGLNVSLSSLFCRLESLLTFLLFLICKKERISLFTLEEHLSLVSFVTALVINLALFCALRLSRFSLDSLCFLERRFCRLLLLCPVRIVALGIVYVGVNNLLRCGNGLNLLYRNGLVTVVERHESGGNGCLVVLSIVCLVVRRSGEFLLHLGSSDACGCFFGEVGLNVCVYGLCRLIPSGCLSRLLERLIFLLLLLHCSGKSSKLLALCALVCLSTLAVIVCVGGEVLSLNGKLRTGKIINAICLDVRIIGCNNADRL